MAITDFALASAYMKKKAKLEGLKKEVENLKTELLQRFPIGTSTAIIRSGVPRLVVRASHIRQVRFNSDLLKTSDPDTYAKYKNLVVEYDTISVEELS